ncbi:MAG: DUF1588 domain-containing protein, partial [Bryobacterales bacterium]|nr:DUF1588 domain-containing protein [Bryobacterales bacterium]
MLPPRRQSAQSTASPSPHVRAASAESPPPPPPPNVPTLEEDAVGNKGTLRQQMEKHRTNAVCASCHSRMDALGFGFENYDAIGAWRDKDGEFALDVS